MVRLAKAARAVPGVVFGGKTDRDQIFANVDLDRLKARVNDYFDPALSHEEIARCYPAAMRSTTSVRLDARAVRDGLLACGGPAEAGFIRCAYRLFDNRLYCNQALGSSAS